MAHTHTISQRSQVTQFKSYLEWETDEQKNGRMEGGDHITLMLTRPLKVLPFC